ncbi:MAG: swi5-like zinc finger protein [Marteilia pararefringens]
MTPSSPKDVKKEKDVRNSVELMELRIKQLESEGHCTEDYEEYLNLLHKYNETKDLASDLVSRLGIYHL